MLKESRSANDIDVRVTCIDVHIPFVLSDGGFADLAIALVDEGITQLSQVAFIRMFS